MDEKYGISEYSVMGNSKTYPIRNRPEIKDASLGYLWGMI